MIVNEVIPRNVLEGNWFLEKRMGTQDRYLEEIDERFKGLIIREVPLLETDVYGIENLRKIGGHLYG
jgi:arsenite-transporting ATPase